ncbi:MAG: Uncharacterized protein JWR17_3506 [Pseudomonas sp.]|uniref:DUF6026 family protein n=1 Tax=Pseudomonas sp. TaxID=306 RepID=UPI0026062B62|nr:DUF6026 family protein [Pseudomonas sp.]MDB6050760.1 Uncharacterized protein [Pseudomonas sp.]
MVTTLLAALPPQTLFVSIRRDELRQLKDENAQLQQKIAHLTLMLQTSLPLESIPPLRQ